MDSVDSFTEKYYQRVLEKSKNKYCFNGSVFIEEAPSICWRHDIDYSPHRALSLAKIESSLELKCVYQILVSSRYYNIFEPETTKILKEIVSLGHEIGLHFDMDVFQNDEINTTVINERIKFEKEVVQELLDCNLESFSFHNHSLHYSTLIENSVIEGMRNLASPRFYSNIKYLSDSNGFWRDLTLEQLIDGPVYPKVQVLTHPIWWTREKLTPIERFNRAVNGRSNADKEFYYKIMNKDGRLEKIAGKIGLSKNK